MAAGGGRHGVARKQRHEARAALRRKQQHGVTYRATRRQSTISMATLALRAARGILQQAGGVAATTAA